MPLQNPASTTLPAGAQSARFSECEEAARYALLQRLAPAIQHHLIGKFQSMGMIAAMMERRLQSAAPDLPAIHEDCVSLGSVSRAAVNAIMNMMSWIEPRTASTLKFDAGVTECLGLLATELRFKGFVIVNQVPAIPVELSSRALRSVLCATLIALSDLSRTPAELVIRAQALPDRIELSIDLRPTAGDAREVQVADYRQLTWRDVEVLAIAESVKLTHGPAGAQLTFSLADESVSLPG
ncbi:MAG: hypothetical protein MUP33_13155 [Polaromonas sp.]|nr:hypothetical protein [Polaromonas sp.]